MKSKLFGLLILVLGLMYACNESINGDDAAVKSGKVTISLTDAPFPAELVEEVNVTIDAIKFKIVENEDSEEEENESGFETLEVDKTFNLLELGNGETEILGELEIPAGEYSEIRMHVTEAKIKLLEVEEEMDIKIPGGSSSGLKIKIKPSLIVSEGEDYEVLLDFDVSRSFLVKGNPKKENIKGFMFKPVIRATNMSMAGSLSGKVTLESDEEVVVKNARIYLISAQEITDTIASGKTNKEGFYKIIGIPDGTYNVNCAKEGYANPVGIEGVDINVGEETSKDFVLQKSEEEITEDS